MSPRSLQRALSSGARPEPIANVPLGRFVEHLLGAAAVGRAFGAEQRGLVVPQEELRAWWAQAKRVGAFGVVWPPALYAAGVCASLASVLMPGLGPVERLWPLYGVGVGAGLGLAGGLWVVSQAARAAKSVVAPEPGPLAGLWPAVRAMLPYLPADAAVSARAFGDRVVLEVRAVGGARVGLAMSRLTGEGVHRAVRLEVDPGAGERGEVGVRSEAASATPAEVEALVARVVGGLLDPSSATRGEAAVLRLEGGLDVLEEPPERGEVGATCEETEVEAQARARVRATWPRARVRKALGVALLGGLVPVAPVAAVWGAWAGLGLEVWGVLMVTPLWAAPVALLLAVMRASWLPRSPRMEGAARGAARRAGGALRLRGHALWFEGERLDLSAPFDVRLYRDPHGRGWVGLVLRQAAQGGGAVVWRLRVPCRVVGGERFELEALHVAGPLLEGEAAARVLWPALRFYAAAQGRALPWALVPEARREARAAAQRAAAAAVPTSARRAV